MKSSNKYILFVLVFVVAFFTGCKPKKDTVAKIYVYNNTNKVIPECRVVLWGKASPDGKGQENVVIYETAYTNSAGEAVFYFSELYQKGMAGVAILNIEAKKGNYNGSGIIKVEEEITNEATVYIAP
ncbi:MAG: hypothetical protein J0G96_12770 [Flavobacteriia bacterium]|nr:hypothetical protein [Flavobacteriia bacterium]OJX37261.1 MAG: hypothetical protein BGO87_01055 [Flavobacteriia bacterium 40-80]